MKIIKKILFGILALLLLPSITSATQPDTSTVKNLAVFYTLEGDIQEKYNTLVENQLKTIGYNLTDPHKRVNDQYKKKYGNTVLDVLSFMPVVNDDAVMPLFNIDPRLAGFSPFNMLIYKKLSEKETHVGHLLPEAILDMLGITDAKVRQSYIDSFKPLDAMLDQELGTEHKSYIPYKNNAKKKMINFEYTFESPEDMDDFLDEFQNKFELAFINKQYLIAGYHNFLDTDNGEEMLEDFDAFWTYSLCHLSYSYNIFDTEGARPDAGLFAPCTMYVYIKKNSNKMVIGMPTLANVKETLDIKAPKRVEWMEKLDREIPEILTSLGMVAVENVNPFTQTPKALSKTAIPKEKPLPKAEKQAVKAVKKAVPPKKEQASESEKTEAPKVQKIETDGEVIEIVIPKPPKVPTPVKVHVEGSESVDASSRSIKFSKRVPPNYQADRNTEKTESGGALGEVSHGRISAYLRGDYMDVKSVEEKLKAAGFEIVGAVPLNKKATLTSVIFTNKTLQEMANKPKRGFAASMRILVDAKKKRISITNPLYITKGFLQKDFDETKAKKVLADILTQFKGLKNSEDALKFQLLPQYQFMKGMPKYEDMVEVASGDGLESKLKNNKRVNFIQKLPNGSILAGVNLSRKTNSFTKRIGTNNAAILPYTVLIENSKAYILDPKYLISFFYPKLKMSEFMTIAIIPDAIVKDCERVFK